MERQSERRRLPPLNALRAFEAAARHLNFSRAAAELGLTPAAVSHQIKELEDQLDLVLFARGGRNLQLTPAGMQLFEAAAAALESLRRAVARARGMARGATQLRISLSARFASNWLLPRLPQFQAAHPQLELSFDIGDALRDFEADDIDLAIRFGRGGGANLCAERLFGTMVAPVCSPRLIATGARLEQPSDLLRHSLYYVDWKTDGMVWPNWRMWMAAAGIEDFDDRRCVGFADSSHVVQAVIDGDGIGLADLEMIGNDLAQGRLQRLFDIAVPVAPDYAYHLVYPQRSREDPRILAFRSWLLEQAGAAAT